MYYLEDLDGRTYAVKAIFNVKKDIDGDCVINSEILPNKVNNVFLRRLVPFWKLKNGSETYTIVVSEAKTFGNKLAKNIRAIPEWINKLDSTREHYLTKPGSRTIEALLEIVFANTGYEYEVVGKFDTIWIEGFGNGDSRLECFKRVLSRFDVEFYLKGTRTIVVQKKIGEKKDAVIHRRLNMSNLSKSIDCENFYTKATGFANYDEGAAEEHPGFEDWEFYKVSETYTSPLAKVIGEREAPPIKDGRIYSSDYLIYKLKEKVDKSIIITVETKVIMMSGRPDPEYKKINVGDTVLLKDTTIGLSEDIRIVQKNTVEDYNGKVLDIDFVLNTSNLNVF